MCLGGPKAPPPPPPPPPPPADPEPVAEGVKKSRAQDKQKAAYLAGQDRKTAGGKAGLLTPAGGQQSQTETLIGG